MTSVSHADCPVIAGCSDFFTGTAELAGSLTHIRGDSRPLPYCLAVLELADLGPHLAPATAVAALPARYLSPPELNLLTSFTHQRRRLQWFGGRLALKHALVNLLGTDHFPGPNPYSALTILNQPSGRPQLQQSVGSAMPVAISLSHSDHYAVGLAALTGSCGIDIQKVTERIWRVTEKFADSEERRLLAQLSQYLPETARLTLLWAAKEAVKKALLHDQPSIFAGIQLQGVSCNDFFQLHFHCASSTQPVATVTAVHLADFILAFTLGDNSHA